VALLREIKFWESKFLVPNPFWLQIILLARALWEVDGLKVMARGAAKDLWASVNECSVNLGTLEDLLTNYAEMLACARAHRAPDPSAGPSRPSGSQSREASG